MNKNLQKNKCFKHKKIKIKKKKKLSKIMN